MAKTFMTKQLILMLNDTKNWWLHYWMFIRLWLYQNHYKLIAVDFIRQKELDADPKTI